jgi:hypothetical protein
MVALFSFLKGMTGALAPFSYLVHKSILKLKKIMQNIIISHKLIHSSENYFKKVLENRRERQAKGPR